MNIPLLQMLVALVESLFKHHAAEVVQAAETAAEKTAEEQAIVDPKIQAGIAAYQAIQNFKAAINTPDPVQAPTQVQEADSAIKGEIDVVGLLLVLLLVGFFGGLPFWGYSHSWGYGPGGFIGLLLLIVLLKVLHVI